MFVRTKTYQRLLEAQLQERERLVQVLVEQVEYLRMQLAMPTTSVRTAVSGPPDLTVGPLVSEQPWVGEEEDDLRAMLQAGVITQAEHDEAIRRVSQRDHIIE